MQGIDRRKFILGSMALGAAQGVRPGLARAAGSESAARYPSRPISIVLPGTPGSTGELTCRLLGNKLHEAWGQPVIVDFKPGASGMVAFSHVARAEPDGYTILLGYSQLVQGPALHKNLPYDVLTDFIPIRWLFDIPMVLVCSDPEVKSLEDYVQRARDVSRKYSYGSQGNGTTSHLHSAFFSKRTGIEPVHVPYKGTAQLILDLISQRVSSAVIDLPAALPNIREGKLRAYAITGKTRSPLVPDVPTFTELGYPEIETPGWYGMFLPAGVDDAIVQKIRAGFEDAIQAPEVRERLSGLGLDLDAVPGDFSTKLRSDIAYWKRAVDVTNVSLE